MNIREIKFNLKNFIFDYMTYETIGCDEDCEELVEEFKELYNKSSYPLQLSIKEYLKKYEEVYSRSELKNHIELITLSPK